MSFIRTEDKKKHHARKLPDGSFEFDGKKEEVGGGSSGSVVTWTSSTVSIPRKQIGAINIDGVETAVYAPNPSIPKNYIDFVDTHSGTGLDYDDRESSSDEYVTISKGVSRIEVDIIATSATICIENDSMDESYEMENPGSDYPVHYKITLLKDSNFTFKILASEKIYYENNEIYPIEFGQTIDLGLTSAKGGLSIRIMNGYGTYDISYVAYIDKAATVATTDLGD